MKDTLSLQAHLLLQVTELLAPNPAMSRIMLGFTDIGAGTARLDVAKRQEVLMVLKCIIQAYEQHICSGSEQE